MRIPAPAVAASAVVISVAGFAAAMLSQEPAHAYVGANACKICHRTEAQGRQYPIWEASLHSKSFTTLTTPRGIEAGKAMGAAEPSKDPKCLLCHAPLFRRAPELNAEGVTCEACHGPGGDYKKLAVMQNREEAIKKGLVHYGSPEAIRAWCLKCHESAHGISFDFPSAWDAIKHPVPKS